MFFVLALRVLSSVWAIVYPLSNQVRLEPFSAPIVRAEKAWLQTYMLLNL